MQKKTISRRSFLKTSTASIGLFSIVPGYVLGTGGHTAPNSKLNIACAGIGGMGKVICELSANRSVREARKTGRIRTPRTLPRSVMWIGPTQRRHLMNTLMPNATKITGSCWMRWVIRSMRSSLQPRIIPMHVSRWSVCGGRNMSMSRNR